MGRSGQMDKNMSQSTISSSKEESIAKAVQLLQGNLSGETSIKRPKISTPRVFLGLVFWICVMVGFVCLCTYMGDVFRLPAYVTHCVAVCGCVLIVALKAKAFVTKGVLLYQKHAPERMRRSCLFVPSCSEYMLLAVEKYGVVVGVCKGLHRLSRCHHPNGGEDYP